MLVGLDQHDALLRLRGSKVGLLAHPASVDRSLRHVSEVLEGLGLRPSIIFGPEHGYGGEAQDMITVADARDRNGVTVRSLYGDAFEDLVPKRADLEGLDVLLVDMQDVGARYYTFIWTAVLAARVARDAGVRVVILDRPNPLGGIEIEGALPVSPLYLSFVGLEPLPIRHGLTLGEVVLWRAKVEGLPEGLVTVVPVQGLDRAAEAPAWDRPFVMPSPNMPTYETAQVYPGGCLLEGTNLSDGRGTTRPFEITGAPWLDGERLARDLNGLGLPGFVARPLTFLPTFHKHRALACGGVQVHVRRPDFRPVATYVALIALAQRQDPARFAFRTERYEFRDDVPAIDLLLGGPATREAILAGEAVRDIAETASQIPAENRAEVLAARQNWSINKNGS